MDESTNSCAIRSSRSMTNADVSSSARETGPDGAELLRELERMRAAVASCAANRGFSGRTAEEHLLLVSRFVPGLSMDCWRELERVHTETGSKSALSGWFALELDPARYPQLAAAFGRKGVPLYRTICPETGALLSEFFFRNMGSELEKACQNGNDVSLLVLELVEERGAIPSEQATDRRQAPPMSRVFAGKASASEIAAAEGDALGPDPDKSPQSGTGGEALAGKLPLLAAALKAYARGCDVPARLADTRMGLLMPGAGALRARAFAERLISAFDETLRRHSGGQSVSTALRVGIACYDPEASTDPQTLMNQAVTALDLARPGGTRTFRKAGGVTAERRTQVQACEKQFLFFGAAEPSK